jgi:hypothetical protein
VGLSSRRRDQAEQNLLDAQFGSGEYGHRQVSHQLRRG